MIEFKIDVATTSPKRFDPWKITAIICVLLSAYLIISPRTPAPTAHPNNSVEVAKAHSPDEATMQEAKATYKPKSIRENLERAKQVAKGFKEQPGEEHMDRMKRFNDYVIEATKEDVRIPK